MSSLALKKLSSNICGIWAAVYSGPCLPCSRHRQIREHEFGTYALKTMSPQNVLGASFMRHMMIITNSGLHSRHFFHCFPMFYPTEWYIKTPYYGFTLLNEQILGQPRVYPRRSIYRSSLRGQEGIQTISMRRLDIA